MGRFDYLQDSQALCIPTRHEELDHELWTHFRDCFGMFPLLHSRYGQGSQDVPPQILLVVACHSVLHPYFLL